MIKRDNFLLLLLGINLIGVAFYFIYYFKYGYLPYPFVYDRFDTYMDFFNPLWRLWDETRYTVWKSVYPPLNFILLKIICDLTICYSADSAFSLRESSNAIYAYYFLYFALVFLIIKTKAWESFSKKEKLLLYLLCITLAPMLFMLERGNLILIAPFLVSLIVNSNSDSKRSFYLGLLCNIKPYFIIFFAYYLIKRQFKNLFVTIFLGLVIFTISALIFDNHSFLILRNIIEYSTIPPIKSARELISFPSSIAVFDGVINIPKAQIFLHNELGSYYEHVKNIVKYLHILLGVGVFAALTYLITIGKNNSDEMIFFSIALIITNMTTSVGGYSLVVYISFIPLLLKLGSKNKIYFIMFIFVMFNYDYLSFFIRPGEPQFSYLYGSVVNSEWRLGISAFLRPIANFILMIMVLIEAGKTRDQLDMDKRFK